MSFSQGRRLTRRPFGTRGSLIARLFRFGCSESRNLNACCAGSVVPARVVLAVVRPPVVGRARCEQPDRVLGVVPFTARSAGRDRVLVWSAHALGSPSDGDRVAEQIVPADRCAREIGAFWVALPALAAAELHRWAWVATPYYHRMC